MIVTGSFILFFGRLLLTGVGLGDALVVGVLGGLLGYLEYIDAQKQMDDLLIKFNDTTSRVEQTQKELEELRSHVSTVKLAQQVRNSARL